MRRLRLAVVLLVLSFGFAGGRALARIDDQPPSPAELLKLYKELELPLPPKDVWLASSKHLLAFQKASATPEDPPLIFQRLKWAYSSTKWSRVPPTPDQASGKLGSGGYVVFAAQCEHLGWHELSQALLDEGGKDDGFEARSEIRKAAWEYWETKLLERKVDRSKILSLLKPLLTADPALATPEHFRLIASLELALAPKQSKPGTTRALIDDLVESSGGWNPDSGISVSEMRIETSSYVKIANLGFEAVPELSRHLYDDRLTRGGVYGVFTRQAIQRPHPSRWACGPRTTRSFDWRRNQHQRVGKAGLLEWRQERLRYMVVEG